MGSAASRVASRATQAELARLFNVSRQSINELVSRGILELGQDGRLDVELARAAIAERVRPSGKTAQALTPPQASPTPATSEAQAAPPPAANDDPARVTSYHVARTLRESAEARLAQLKLRQAEGDLVERADVEREAYELARRAREMLAGIPDRLATQLAAEPDPVRVHAALEEEVRRICDALAGPEE